MSSWGLDYVHIEVSETMKETVHAVSTLGFRVAKLFCNILNKRM